MTNLFRWSVLFFAPVLAIGATPPLSTGDPAVVAEAERSFAKAGLEHGIRASFLDYFADDSIVFAPGPTNARTFYTNYKEKGLALIWQPAFATIAISGELGVTTGPWQVKKSSTDSDAIAFGEFLSVWKLQSDRSWKVVFDTGIDHAQPASSPVELELVRPKTTGEGETARRTAFAEAVTTLTHALAGRGTDALIDQANQTVRILRDDSLPILGRAKAKDFFATNAAKVSRENMGGSNSQSADLAYDYGSYSEEHANGTSEKGHFVTIWQIDSDGKWKVIIDLQKKAPPAEEKQGKTSNAQRATLNVQFASSALNVVR